MSNRLAKERSPYLLQHAHNPVDWYPWGEEAFEKAEREDKPILLSIGYSTCHWCHVMERESFENEDIAKLMNEHYVCIKLDREERPDVDKIYMTAVQAMTGQGGWPLNVFLTPELQPFFGGTYFPPAPRFGQPAWPQLLARIAELWTQRREDLRADAAGMTQALQNYAAARGEPAAPDLKSSDACYEALGAMYDARHKGFGHAPKFPMPAYLSFLLRRHKRTGEERALSMAVETLEAMAAGGIFDQLGGGFSRYSTDELWRVPHFEKMLYDNAQLAAVAAEAYALTRKPSLAAIVRRTLDYLLRDMRHPDGGFFSAEDADSAPAPGAPKSEGAFYLWSKKELEDALGADAAAFCARYGVQDGGNAPHDPHGEFVGRNVLYDAAPGEPDRFTAAREKLLALRAQRPRPGLDDKVLSSWNGLALSAFAKAAMALEEPLYLDAAREAADFLYKNLWDGKQLWRRWREGDRAVPGTSDDYSFVAQGLLDLFDAGGDAAHLDWAMRLAEELQGRFGAPDGGFYMTAEDHDARLLIRVVEDSDNVEPCASSVGASVLLRLSRLTERADLREAGERTLSRFGGLMAERPSSLPAMLGVVEVAHMKPLEIVVAGDAGLLAEARRRFLPQALVVPRTDAAAKLCPWLEDIPAQPAPRAYACEDYACGTPVTTREELAKRLDGR